MSTGNVKESKQPIPPDEFVRVYMGSDSIKEVATKLGITSAGVISRAKAYRKAGVKLKDMPRMRRKVDAQSLNQLISELET